MRPFPAIEDLSLRVREMEIGGVSNLGQAINIEDLKTRIVTYVKS